MPDTEDRIDYSKFTRSLERLVEQHHHLVYDTDEYPPWNVDGMRESVIQRFEVCFDTSWKHLRRHLTVAMGVNQVPNSPVAVFRIAAESLLLGGEEESWMAYNNARIDTSHDYNIDKRDATLAIVPKFIEDAINLHERLTGEPWVTLAQ